MIRPRSLSAKILLLGLLNLALIAAALLVFARLQFRLSFESMLLSPSFDRIMAMARSMALELEETPVEGREELLARYGRNYGARFYLFDQAGTRLAGQPVQLPGERLQRLLDSVPPPYPRVAGPDGPPPGQDEPPRPGPPDRIARLGRPTPQSPVFLVRAGSPTRYWIGARIPIRSAGDRNSIPGTVLVEANSIFNSNLFFDFRLLLAVVLAIAAISVLCWLPFVRGVARALSEMDDATGRIAEGHFDVHVSEQRTDELGRLGRQINLMASRLSGYVARQKRLLGDISHELCAPIARVQFALGILDQRADDGQRKHVNVLNEEVQHMSGLINELLMFSKAGIKAADTTLMQVNVASTIERVVARETASGGSVEVSLEPRLYVTANEKFLFRSLSNLLRNAIRYAGGAGPISITARREEREVVITVADCGPGLPEEAIAEVFEPFYRPEASRSRETGGVGLGLAIVKSCIESCRGSVSCRNRTPSGLEVTLRLPIAASGAAPGAA